MSDAKLFTPGGSQAVRLPEEFCFEGKVVHVRRVSQEVVLSAVPPPRARGPHRRLMSFEPGTPLRRDPPEEPQRRAPIRPLA